MSFRIRYHPRLNRRIRSWQLPDPVFIEVYLRFHRLENDPLSLLRRVEEPFDGESLSQVCRCSIREGRRR